MKTDGDVRRFFDEEFPDAVPLMPTLLEDFRNNPTGSFVTIRCAPWFYRDKACLVGDAAHAVVPFYCLYVAGFEQVEGWLLRVTINHYG